jgi:hypothetical protein
MLPVIPRLEIFRQHHSGGRLTAFRLVLPLPPASPGFRSGSGPENRREAMPSQTAEAWRISTV